MSSNYIDDCYVPGQSRTGMNAWLNPVHQNQQPELKAETKWECSQANRVEGLGAQLS